MPDIKITDYPSPNYFINNSPIRAIVLHGTAGSKASALDWLTRAASQVSANYLIDLNGNIYRLVAYYQSKRAWANGYINNPDPTINFIQDCIAKSINPNLVTISIEHEAPPWAMEQHIAMPPIQFEASLWLTRKLLKGLNLPATRQTIIGHNQLDRVTRPNCPGVINISDYIAGAATSI